MSDALEDHKSSVSIGGRIVINFLFADHVCDIVVNAEEEEEADGRYNLYNVQDGDWT